MTNREIKFILRLRDEATAQWDKFNREIQSGIGKIKSGFAKFGPLIAGAFSIGALKEFIGASNEQEVATAKLTQALKNQGITSVRERQAMEDYSSSLQKTTIFGDEQITNIQAQLVAMTGLTGNAIKPLTKATLDLASGLNIDAESAGQLIAKTIEGQDALGRYGLSVKGARTESEKIAKIIELVGEKFGGMSEAVAGTAAGRMKQFANLWGDLKEDFGELLKNVLSALLPTLQHLVQILLDAPPAIQAVILAVGALSAAMVVLGLSMGPVTLGIGAIVAIGAGLITHLNASKSASDEASNSMTAYAKAIGLVTDQTERVAGATKQHLKEEIESLNDQLAKEKDHLGGLAETFGDVIGFAKDGGKAFFALSEEQQNVQAGSRAVADEFRYQGKVLAELEEKLRITTTAFDKAPGSVDPASGSISSMTKRIKDLKESLEGVQIGSSEYNRILVEMNAKQKALDDAVEDANVAIGSQMKTVAAASATFKGFDLSEFEKSLDKLPGLINLTNKALPKIDVASLLPPIGSMDEFNRDIAVTQALLAETGMDTPGFDVLREKLSGMRKQFEWALLAPVEKAAAAMAHYGDIAKRALGLVTKAGAQNARAQIDAIETERDTRLEAINIQLESETISEEVRQSLLAQRTKAEAEYAQQIKAIKVQQFESEKQASIIEATINTAVAVSKALADGGFFAGPAFAAIVGALGAAEIAIIASQPTPKFHEGTGDDSVADKIRKAPASKEFPILVRGGETIRTERQEAELQERINSTKRERTDSYSFGSVSTFSREELLGGSIPIPLADDRGGIGAQRVPSGGRSFAGAEAQAEQAQGERGGSPVIININSPLTDDEWVVNALVKRLRKTGLSIDQVVVNPRRNVKLGRGE